MNNETDENPFVAVLIDGSNAAMVASSAISASGGATVTLVAEVEAVEADQDQNTEAVEGVDAFEADATFNGASGTLMCAGTSDCTVTVDADGKITAATGALNFTPVDGDDGRIDVEDESYLAYGFWLKRTAQEDGSTKYDKYDEIETFTMAVGVAETADGSGSTQIGSVTGSAIYTGNATGVYVKNVTDDQAAITSATSGVFSADVVLDANFGGGDIGVNSQFLIEGSVTKFVLDGELNDDWNVKLDAADFSGRTEGAKPAGTNFMNTFNGVTIGDSTADKGTWNGAFYGAAGSAIDHDVDPDTATINQAPSAVLGEFGAEFTDGAAAGAFGAKK